MQTFVDFRYAVTDDIKRLVEMTQEEDWWYTVFEYSVLMKLDPFSLIVATDECRLPVGFLGICKILPGITYFGPLIVRRNHRGSGIGKIFIKAMLLLQAENNGCMDLDDNFVGHYSKKGFSHKSYKFNCFDGIVSDKCRGKTDSNRNCSIALISYNDLPYVTDYDKSVYLGLERKRILEACLFNENVLSVTAVCDGNIKGYGSLIKCETTNKYRIASLLADDDFIVEKILEKMIDVVPNGALLTLQIVEDKQLSERFSHFRFCFTMQRVFNKHLIKTDLKRMYFVNYFMFQMF